MLYTSLRHMNVPSTLRDLVCGARDFAMQAFEGVPDCVLRGVARV